jgi:hypothetical protein
MLGDACGDCQITVGDGCIPCPDNVDFPECAGCVNGVRAPTTDVTHDLLVPVVIGVVTTLTIALITHHLLQQK